MTDAVQVFPPGFRVVDSNGDPLSGAQVRFFAAGTSTPKTVYSDDSLSVPLGSIVYTRSDGYLVSAQGGSTTVTVFVGVGDYKVDILDSNSATVYPAKDNVRGALDTSNFLTTGQTSSLVIPVTAIATDTTLAAGNTGTLIHTTGAITITLPNPAVVGNDWNCKIRCNDASNATKLVASAGTIKGVGFSVAFMALSGLGAEVEIVCDGANMILANRMLGLPLENGRLFTFTSRVSSAPASTAGNWYLVSAGFGAFSTGDVIEATGNTTFIGYTPPANSGWMGYSQGDNALYRHATGGWTRMTPAPLPTVQRFTSGTSLTYTPAANVVRIKVRMCGGGGGGGATATNNGTNGNTTTFGSWTAIGGNGGTNGSTPAGAGPLGGTGGTGGAAGTGTLVVRLNGGTGFGGMTGPSGNQAIPGGSGGVNPFGGAGAGGAGGNGSNATGLAGATNTGAGGGGAGGFVTSANGSGAGGGAGEYVEFWVDAPSPTVYTVAAAANGGAAGTFAGGNGAAGVIIIEEFY